MTKLTSILVATDLSTRSDRAVRRAAYIARTHDAALTVLTIMDNAMPAEVIDTLHSKTRAALERFVAVACEGVKVTVRAEPGDPTVDIMKACDGDVDLLVMGTHRIRPFLDALRETTMERIVRHVSTPVLLVTDRADHHYANVLGACDFSPASGAALRMAHAVAPEATLHPVHALNVPYAGRLSRTYSASDAIEASFRREAEGVARKWYAAETLPTDKMTDLEILPGKGEMGDADLIAVGAHGRVGAMRSLLGSLATDLMRDPPCDVVIARP